MKILHLFYSTLPSAKGGDIRSRDVVESQKEIGLDVLALSSPFQPPAVPGAIAEVFGGVTYHRCFHNDGDLLISEHDQGLKVKLRKMLKLFAFSDVVVGLAQRKRPDMIHAHSSFFCAFAGKRAARKLKLPLVYEVRSLWEERSVMKAPSLRTRTIARVLRAMETRAMHMADHVVVISEGLRHEVVTRGISADRVTVIGNAVNLSRVTAQRASVSVKASSDWVFAYIGSLSDIEGLDLLITAVRKLRGQGWTNQVRFYGDGPASEDLRGQAQGVDGISFHGSFQPDDVSGIYAAVDVIVNPRRSSPLTEKVTPLKPLEAMGWCKPVITSSIGGMLELVRDGRTGLIFDADDSEALAKTLKRATDSPEIMTKLVEQAWHFITAERSWRANSLKYKELYVSMARASA